MTSSFEDLIDAYKNEPVHHDEHPDFDSLIQAAHQGADEALLTHISLCSDCSALYFTLCQEANQERNNTTSPHQDALLPAWESLQSSLTETHAPVVGLPSPVPSKNARRMAWQPWAAALAAALITAALFLQLGHRLMPPDNTFRGDYQIVPLDPRDSVQRSVNDSKPHAGSLLLSLRRSHYEPYDAYRLTVTREQDATPIKQLPLSPPSVGAYAVSVTGQHLAPDRYLLQVEGAKEGVWQPLEQYLLVLAPPSSE